VLQAVLAAVWFHGRAADCLSQMTASDLAPMAARLLARASRPPRGGGR
jgi:NAD(P)H-hydrate repair Nnr-like enzyme with NAD(P)H-hydrate dehydratase domain